MRELELSTCGILISRLTALLANDNQCKNLLEKLTNRLGILMMGANFDPEKLLINPPAELCDVKTLPEFLEVVTGLMMTTKSIRDKAIVEHGHYLEWIAMHHAYVAALEERYSALLSEFVRNGGDASFYPNIPKVFSQTDVPPADV